MSTNLAGLPPRYLRTPEAARFVGLSVRTLEKHRIYGTGPRYSKLGGRVVYRARRSAGLGRRRRQGVDVRSRQGRSCCRPSATPPAELEQARQPRR